MGRTVLPCRLARPLQRHITNRHLRSLQHLLQPGPQPEAHTPQYRFLRAMMAASSPRSQVKRETTGSPAAPPAPVPAAPVLAAPLTHVQLQQRDQDRASRLDQTRYILRNRPAGVIQRLSDACQTRGFNLRWLARHPRGGRDGLYRFHVDLQGFIVHGDRRGYDSVEGAKEAVAQKALRYLEGSARDRQQALNNARPGHVGRSAGPSSSLTHPPPSRASTIPPRSPTLDRDRDHRRTGPAPSARAAPAQSEAPNGEAAALLDHVWRVLDVSPPREARQSVEAARVFLQGLALGAGIASSATSSSASRRRSRSPLLRRSRSRDCLAERGGVYPERAEQREYRERTPPSALRLLGDRCWPASPPLGIGIVPRRGKSER
ncbi:hypothetical protein VTJ83DRAFT_165 [Remersonia thermophila]|uniref:DRBM domain-containing protein n=1 Tax=Remersonia thermophila TaxID=72144 RepID=A0ABR4DMN4_9PEZI